MRPKPTASLELGFSYENSNGLFKGEVDDATVSSFSITIADVEGRSHGMDLERLLSFSKGDTQGLADGCDQYSSGTPISPPPPSRPQ